MGFGKDGRGAIIREQTSGSIGALSAQDEVQIGTALALIDDFRILKTELFAHVRGLTAGEGNGGILVMADGDLTSAEVEAALEVDAPLAANDSVGAAVAERWTKTVAALVVDDVTNTFATFRGDNGGTMITVKPRWTFGAASRWKWYFYNQSGATIQTGATVELIATHFGVWIR